ncbi:MAG: DUF4198 domain-containing protein [Flavobacteriaceae bacterium]
MKRAFIFLGILFLFSSHELFLKTDSYFLSEGEAVELYLYNGTFDKSENVISRDRIENSKVLGPDFEFRPEDTDYFDKDQTTYLKFTSGKTGSYVAGISTLARNIELTAAEFKEYLEHEGLDRMVKQRDANGKSGQDVVEKYSKHVKALLQVGSETSGDYNVALGYPIEFIPLHNPYELSVGDNIEFQLIYKGKPLANEVVHFSSRKDTDDSENRINASITDEDGKFSFELNQAGKWYVGTIHMRESEEEAIDYESNWATLTFEIRNKK